MIRKWLMVVLGVALLGLVWQRQFLRAERTAYPTLSVVTAESPSAEPVIQPVIQPVATATPTPVAAVVPTTVTWQAPFTTQAPETNWDGFHEEMCEEASLLIAAAWYHADTRARIPVAEAEQQLSDMAAWERSVIGTDISTTTAQMAQVATDYLHIPSAHLTVQTVTSVDELKKLVSNGVVVAPFAGRLLGNPHFTGAGPRYHASVIIGYTDREFVVHDVGTRYGADYHYKTTVLWTALHDFIPEPGQITDGAKTVLAFTRS